MGVQADITAADIAALPLSGRTYYAFPEGFGIRRTKGGASYFFRWKSGGKFREMSLGVVGQVTLTQARRKASKLRTTLDDGTDPLDAKRAKAAQEAAARAAAVAAAAARVTLSDFYTDTYSKAVVKKESTRRMDESQWKNHVEPSLGAVAVGDITKVHVQKLFDSLSATPVRANRCYAFVAHMLAEAAQRGYRSEPLPRKALRKNAEKPRTRFLSPIETKRLWDALTALETAPKTRHRHAAQALRLIVATGCRKQEVVGLAWSEVDLEERRLVLGDSKVGGHCVPLTGEAAAILKERLGAAGGTEKAGTWVFPSRDGKKPRSAIERTWRKALKEAKLDSLHIHDCRHAFAANAVAAGLSLPEIGSLLGHKTQQSTARYSHVARDVARAAADRVGARLSEIVTPMRVAK